MSPDITLTVVNYLLLLVCVAMVGRDYLTHGG